MFSQPSDPKSDIIYDLNDEPHVLSTRKRNNQEQELNDRAIAEALAEDLEAFDLKPSHQGSRNQLTQNQLKTDAHVIGTRITPVPKRINIFATENTSDENTMPNDIRGITLGYLDDNCSDDDIVSETKTYPFAPTSSRKFTFFNQTDLPVTAFLKHVVHGDLKEAKAMLDKDPSLVLYSGRITNYAGQMIEGTGYKIALGAEDVSRKNHPKEGMADMIRPYFIKALEGDENRANDEISKQFREQFPIDEFPEYYETDEIKRAEIIKRKEDTDPDIQQLETIAMAILCADAKEIIATRTGKQDKYGYDEYQLEVTGECAKALQAYREHLNPQGVIKSGKHFNAHLLITALEKYVGKQYDSFGGHWHDPKNLLFWRQVIGYIERYLPANVAQAFCQGLYNVTDGGEPLKRNLTLDDKSFFYPSGVASSSGLGFDHSVYSYLAGGGCGPRLVVCGALCAAFSSLMSSKNNSLSIAYAACRRTIKEGGFMRDVVDCRRNNKL